MIQDLTFGMAVFFYGSVIFFCLNLVILWLIRRQLISLDTHTTQFMGVLLVNRTEAVRIEKPQQEEPYKIHNPEIKTPAIVTPVKEEKQNNGVQCRFCGATKRGIKIHERFCKSNPENIKEVDDEK